MNLLARKKQQIKSGLRLTLQLILSLKTQEDC
jgi:hypothetical protein